MSEWAFAGISDLQAAMASGALSACELVEACVARVAAFDTRVRAVVEINPDALAIAAALDTERREGRVRGALHGIPVLLKDNIDSGDRMMTTAGSLALVGPPAATDATAAARLRASGAVLLGKTNLSEWANFRGHRSTSGWSGRGGQTHNPHALDRSPGGSSSGSGAAVAAGFTPVALGTETDGSIVNPATSCGVVGFKPTVGLTSRAGVIPISHTQDTVGPLARSVADAAAVLTAIAGGADARDPATGGAPTPMDYTRFLDRGGLRGARIGVPRRSLWGRNRDADRIGEEALRALRDAGATLIDPAEIPSFEEARGDDSEYEVMLYEFKAGVNAYLASRQGLAVRTLSDVISFNEAHATRELPWFGQEILTQAQTKGSLTDADYVAALERSRALGGRRGIDAALQAHGLDALVAPSGGPAWTIDPVLGDHGVSGSSSYSARAGYPLVSVPAGFAHGLPLNLSFIGRAWSEPVLVRLAYAFEQATRAWRAPAFAGSVAVEGA